MCHQTPRNRLLDSCDTPEESTEPWLNLHVIWWFESKDFIGIKADNIWLDSFSQDILSGLLQLCCQTFDDGIMLQMIPNVYELNNLWTLGKKCLRILPPTPPFYSNVTLIGFQSVHFLLTWDSVLRKVPSLHQGTKICCNWETWLLILSEKNTEQNEKM